MESENHAKAERKVRAAAKRLTDARTERDEAVREAYAAGLSLRQLMKACGYKSWHSIQKIVAADDE